MQRLFFFGTFNPVHYGHLWLAQAALATGQVSHITWVPAYHPPHRAEEADLASFDHRLTMLRRALAHDSRFDVNPIEASLPTPSYTVNTLDALVPTWCQPDATPSVGLLMGADQFETLASWHQAERLRQHLTFWVATRDQQTPLCPPNTKLFPVPMPETPLSARALRARLQTGQPLTGWTPECVLSYIQWNQLYQTNPI